MRGGDGGDANGDNIEEPREDISISAVTHEECENVVREARQVLDHAAEFRRRNDRHVQSHEKALTHHAQASLLAVRPRSGQPLTKSTDCRAEILVEVELELVCVHAQKRADCGDRAGWTED
eukprot:COSAG02_NODE_699_length_18369_cov_9.690203_6_plen_121_part_00